jgi:cytidyltransferase-like protein
MFMNEKSQNSLEFLKLITSELDKNNIPYWIDCGTLLGAYRESDFIEHDGDIDISVNIDHINIVTDIFKNLEKLNLIDITKYKHEGIDVSDRLIKLAYKKNNIFVDCRWMDIYFYRKKGDIYEHCLFSDQYNSKLKTPSKCIEHLNKIKIKDAEFSCPSYIKTVLKSRYGRYYMVPQTRCNEHNKEWTEVNDNVSDAYLFDDNKDPVICYTSLVGDMFHTGHFNLLKKCRDLFDKVIVGVHNDEGVMTYKDKPIDSYEVRLKNIKDTGLYDEIYENAPVITTQSFIDSLNIDFVVAGKEEDEKINKMYPINKKQLYLINRTPGISSSLLKNRIKSVL